MKIGVLSNLLSFTIISIISLLVGFTLYLLGIDHNETLITSGTIFAIFLIFILLYKNKIKRYYAVWGLNWLINALDDQFGIEKVYKNFFEAKSDMMEDFNKSKNIYLFFQLGRADIGGQGSLLFDDTMKSMGIRFNQALLQ